jgi:hypothetical protein
VTFFSFEEIEKITSEKKREKREVINKKKVILFID